MNFILDDKLHCELIPTVIYLLMVEHVSNVPCFSSHFNFWSNSLFCLLYCLSSKNAVSISILHTVSVRSANYLGCFLTYRTRIYPSGTITFALHFPLFRFVFCPFNHLRFQPWVSCVTPQILSLCIFAFRIKILNEKPCAGLIVHTTKVFDWMNIDNTWIRRWSNRCSRSNING